MFTIMSVCAVFFSFDDALHGFISILPIHDMTFIVSCCEIMCSLYLFYPLYCVVTVYCYSCGLSDDLITIMFGIFSGEIRYQSWYVAFIEPMHHNRIQIT